MSSSLPRSLPRQERVPRPCSPPVRAKVASEAVDALGLNASLLKHVRRNAVPRRQDRDASVVRVLHHHRPVRNARNLGDCFAATANNNGPVSDLGLSSSDRLNFAHPGTASRQERKPTLAKLFLPPRAPRRASRGGRTRRSGAAQGASCPSATPSPRCGSPPEPSLLQHTSRRSELSAQQTCQSTIHLLASFQHSNVDRLSIVPEYVGCPNTGRAADSAVSWRVHTTSASSGLASTAQPASRNAASTPASAAGGSSKKTDLHPQPLAC